MTKKNNNESSNRSSKSSSKNLSQNNNNNNNSFNFGSEALKHHTEIHSSDEKRYNKNNISSNKFF